MAYVCTIIISFDPPLLFPLIYPSTMIQIHIILCILHYSAIPCPCPSQPANGQISCTSRDVGGRGSAVRYWCNSGYFMKGNSHRICQTNGTWGPEPPVCIRGNSLRLYETPSQLCDFGSVICPLHLNSRIYRPDYLILS